MNYITKFPYQRSYITDKEIHKMFDNLKKYNYKNRIISKSYTIKNINIPSYQLAFLEKPLLLITKPEDFEDWERLSDMFQEECRMKCKLFRQKESPEEYFYSHIKEINQYTLNKYGKITPQNVRETIYNLTKECTSHKPSHIMSMIEMFKAKTVLDFSSGWGDRLIGAMAADVDFYCGVDPNPCLHPNYQKMINFFGKSPKNFVMIESTIEDAKLPNRKFDLIFTSPPYFDLEIYRENKKQSTKHKQEVEWFNNFFKIALNKVWKYLHDGGIMCININQKSREEHYIKWMQEEVNKFEDSNYLGVISYSKPKIDNPQPIWIWKKHNFKIETERLYLRKFRMSDAEQMAKIVSKKDNMEYIASGKTMNNKETKNMIEKYIKDAYTFYPISFLEKSFTKNGKNGNVKNGTTDKIIGYLGYFNGVYLDKKYVGMNFTRILIDSSQRGKGYGKEIYSRFLKHLNKLMYAMILPKNKASIKLHLSVGFKLDKQIEFHGKKYNLYKYKPN